MLLVRSPRVVCLKETGRDEADRTQPRLLWSYHYTWCKRKITPDDVSAGTGGAADREQPHIASFVKESNR